MSSSPILGKRTWLFRYVIDPLSIALATGCGIGFAKRAPGTFGSIPGLAVGVALQGLQDRTIIILALVSAVIAALAVIARTERVWNTHDDQRIVIDEVVGIAIPAAFFPATPLFLIATFVVFRIFDIKKPGPIGWADRDLPGAYGTLLDDVIAGIVTLVVLYPLVWLTS